MALTRDIPARAVAPGRLGAEDVAIWRGESGRISVWSDRCPHRGMRLSHGFVRGEALSCIYHGWRYGEGGGCLRIPAHPELTPPGAIRAVAFAAAEAAGVIWAAPEAPGTEPPAYPGFTGFRSLAVEAPPERLAAALGGGERARLAGLDVVALIQPLGPEACRLHLLAPEGAPPEALDALSAAAEGLRRDVERERAA